MAIAPYETQIVGHWMKQGDTVLADDDCDRIRTLTTEYLCKVAVDVSGWLTLYQDPSDGRYWLLAYPHSEIHGGGPPELRLLSEEEARATFRV